MINNSNLKDKDQKKERKDERKKEQKEKEKGLGGGGDNKTQRKDILQEGEKKAIFTLRKKK